tara:strand:+ start:303 stop:719 length:417 start_codon:yes stop_codon:yes gene_type:complete
MKFSIFLFIIFLFSPLQSYAESYLNEDKRLFFITPSNGEEVTNPVTIRFGIVGMEIVPAGKDKPMSGHHHLLIDVDELPDLKSPIPADSNHLHFGAGQTETEINLPEGKHTLQLLLGNYLHIPHEDPLMSEKIEITVK